MSEYPTAATHSNSASKRELVDAALASLSADVLRDVVRQVLLVLDERGRARVVASLLDRAARTGSGWAPAAVTDEQVAQALAFAKAAVRSREAPPSKVDEHLQRGSIAFLQRDYPAAHRIFGALLVPVSDGRIYLGQRDVFDDVLGVDVAGCATQYVVATYMLAPALERAEAVRAAIAQVHQIGFFMEPLREMERVAVEPLADLAAFLPRWHALLASEPTHERSSGWEQSHWLREVVHRLEGVEGLAKVARASRRADDLRAWCNALVKSEDSHAALEAYVEAAELVTAEEHTRGEFLDGAALAAQCLERTDLPVYLERAWRAHPSMSRLRRWLGSSNRKATLDERTRSALEACPEGATQQRALLHVLLQDFGPAAALLASAPSLGWSNGEHPGPLLFPLFARMLGASLKPVSRDLDPIHYWTDRDEREAIATHRAQPRLSTPKVDGLLALAGVANIPDATSRRAMVAAMRKAAERRVAGVTEQKRRRHYCHAAELVALCVASERTAEAARWAAALQTEYKRFPALQSELERALRAA